jgi:DNA invertase Pin-like site-specific DNA recombinase
MKRGLKRFIEAALGPQKPATYSHHKGDRCAVVAARNRIILAAHEDGYSAREIARGLGVSASTVGKVLGDYRWGIDVQRSSERQGGSGVAREDLPPDNAD